ncbi:cation:proton antiporter [Novosphingobium terrae]|uniref:cation:proton antiporter n=1 Tax=Novosphingobium terrae TaxID=2726189 RepID=UPI001981EB67|nr:cation:proton antiporter [Novosphingobium terrae]
MLAISYPLTLLVVGALLLFGSWLPMLLSRFPLSLPMLCLAGGFGLSFTHLVQLPPMPWGNSDLGEKINEIIVVLALMEAGLRIDRRFSIRSWASVWRLLLVSMPLTILALMLLGHYFLGFGWAASLLLATALAPTDPVLAADVQTGPPGSGDDGETRFALTAEAGLNDGLAFPFILLALMMQSGANAFGHWLAVDTVGELAIGTVVGLVVGRSVGLLLFRLPSIKLSNTGEGLAAVGATLLCYAATTMLHGNGFVAVFIAAIMIRVVCPQDAFHVTMAEFAAQVERVLVMLILLILGWGLGSGLLAALTPVGAAVALGLILIIRPVSALIAFRGSRESGLSRRLIGFFGVRGIGTLYYLQYAFNRSVFAERAQIWAVCSLAIAASIFLHGLLTKPAMARADARRARRSSGTREDLLLTEPR